MVREQGGMGSRHRNSDAAAPEPEVEPAAGGPADGTPNSRVAGSEAAGLYGTTWSSPAGERAVLAEEPEDLGLWWLEVFFGVDEDPARPDALPATVGAPSAPSEVIGVVTRVAALGVLEVVTS